jgi:hypothetical protein
MNTWLDEKMKIFKLILSFYIIIVQLEGKLSFKYLTNSFVAVGQLVSSNSDNCCICTKHESPLIVNWGQPENISNENFFHSKKMWIFRKFFIDLNISYWPAIDKLFRDLMEQIVCRPKSLTCGHHRRDKWYKLVIVATYPKPISVMWRHLIEKYIYFYKIYRTLNFKVSKITNLKIL